MRTLLWIGIILIVGGINSSQADNPESVWVGQRFEPSQLVTLSAGEAVFTRKLCTIRYRMRPADDHFAVTAQLTFNPRLVPRRPRTIDLEILPVDTRYVCIRKIDQHHSVVSDQVAFAVEVPRDNRTRYLRTYYTLHYD